MEDRITTINKEVIRRLYQEVLVDWNMTAVDELIAPQFISHDWQKGSPTGPQPFRDFYSGAILPVLPDARYEVDDLIAEGDRVVVRWRLLGTHKGSYHGIAPTGKAVTLKGIAIYRLEAGKVAERWVVTDIQELFNTMKNTA